MKMILFTLCTVLLLSLTVGVHAADKAEKVKKEPKVKKEKAAGETRKGDLFHVVAFKFKESATEAQITEVEDAFRKLKKTVKQIKKYEWGTNRWTADWRIAVGSDGFDRHTSLFSFIQAPHRQVTEQQLIAFRRLRIL